MPIIFYTALPKHVLPDATSFVKVVEKTAVPVTGLKSKVQEILDTGLPQISRMLDDTQREYMWNFVQTNWRDFESTQEQSDLAYLLARRLALTLEKKARKLVRPLVRSRIAVPDPFRAHPMEMYVYPPLSGNHLAGEILKEE